MRLRYALAAALFAFAPAMALAQASSGNNPGHILSTASNNATSIKSSPGVLIAVSWINTGTNIFDIRFYDTAVPPNCSSATGVKFNWLAQSNATSAGGAPPLGPNGAAFFAGIGVCITGANADNDNTNATTGLNLNFVYQ